MIVFLNQSHQRRLDNSTTKPQKNQMQCRLLLDVVVSNGLAIFKLLFGEDRRLLYSN
uniref:Uncharacterized protein n=1 Tax=Nelumbo nucifera TaxID=4432 RepID=A0A822ZCI9_NELNU|nr:TPA_asm: hypothetical protein HUJ06_015714 [Nelumbo nucifera]